MARAGVRAAACGGRVFICYFPFNSVSQDGKKFLLAPPAKVRLWPLRNRRNFREARPAKPRNGTAFASLQAGVSLLPEVSSTSDHEAFRFDLCVLWLPTLPQQLRERCTRGLSTSSHELQARAYRR